MTADQDRFNPDFAVPPGWILEERLEVNGMSQAEFARRCGRSAKLISKIIAGKAPLEPGTALQFERVLDLGAGVWLRMEAAYRLHLAREAEAEQAAESAMWINALPVNDLVKRGCFERPESDSDAYSKLLGFFGVGSVNAWNARYCRLDAAFCHSKSFESDEFALATWLRLGQIEAERQNCSDFNGSRFRRAVLNIRALTREPVEVALEQSRELCNEAGVALAVVRPIPMTRLSGAAWWLSPAKAVVQLSGRHMTDDHLWFSFFHEAAHLALHSKKGVFVDEMNRNDDKIEAEANAWASNTLVPRSGVDSAGRASSYKRSNRRKICRRPGYCPWHCGRYASAQEYCPLEPFE